MSATTKPSLTLERHIKAAPEKVYAAWTDAEHVMRWFGPAGAEMISAEVDARVGGRFHMVFRTPDGEEHDVSGTFREVEPDRRLTFSWMWRTLPDRASVVSLTFRRERDGTLLTLTHSQFFDEGARDRHRDGWSGTLEKLAVFLEAISPATSSHFPP